MPKNVVRVKNLSNLYMNMKKWQARKLLLGLLFILGIFVIFFVGRSFDATTGERHFTLTLQGVKEFRLWLDVSGGTRLIYRINYDKYDELYTDQTELNEVKKMIETIILKNIDKRISKLGVSDYRSYVQQVNEEPYIIVEIWGVANLEQAKDIIGKTVELEFRLPNTEESSASEQQARKIKAKELLAVVLDEPEMFEDLTINRGSENIEYHIFSWVSLMQLPQMYQQNPALLRDAEVGIISPTLVEGLYTTFPTQDEFGEEMELELNGYTFFRLLEKRIETKEQPDIQDFLIAVQMHELEYVQSFSAETSLLPWAYDYDVNNQKILFNVGPVAEGQVAYKAMIYQISNESTLGKSDEEITDLEATRKALADDIKAHIEDEAYLASLENVQLVNDNWIDILSLQQSIPSFVDQDENTIEIFEQGATTVVIAVESKKSAEQSLYQVLEAPDVSASIRAAVQADMKEKVLYTIEDVFVQDKLAWVSAIDSVSNKVLNGAYFKFASVGASQMGEPVVNITFDGVGKDIFCNITQNHINDQMAIFVGGEIKTAPVIRSKICDGVAMIEGDFSSDEAKELVDDLNEWTLPAPLVLMQEEKISPTLGTNALKDSLIAAAIGVILIVLLMLFMYGWRKALVTMGVLIAFIVILLMIMKLIDYALSLSGIAAIILSIGMGVDANILIFERVREELKNKKTIASAIEIGHKRSRAPIRDGNVSTGLIAFLLFTLGINMFKGFGSMMLLNIILILLINVPLTKDLLQLMFHKKKIFLKESELDKQLK